MGLELNSYQFSKNRIVRYLDKSPLEFTKSDIIDYIINNGIECVTFLYAADDGRLKSLDFAYHDLQHLDTILTYGERVDGSSLFRHIDPANSDLYVIPRYRTAFVDPSDSTRLYLLCTFFDKNGQRMQLTPEYTLEKACHEFTTVTGLEFQAMGELEYYVIGDDDATFPATDQRGYHESEPFAKFNDFRRLCMNHIAQTGAMIKYGHSEVGNFTLNGKIYEQNEIEFLPVDALQAAEQLLLSKWIIRKLARQHNLNVTFAPKISEGKAGSGLHVHMRLVDKSGRNMMRDSAGNLSHECLLAIAGLMKLAPAITAVGNTVPTSYCRLVPHQEAPTSICWSECNRSVLVRVPLGWNAGVDMSALVNPVDTNAKPTVLDNQRQTIEIRSGDASADVYLLMAALAVACRTGWELKNAEQIAASTHVTGDIHATGADLKLDSLPASCAESADRMQELSSYFTARGVFNEALIQSIIGKLQAYPEANTTDMATLVAKYFHCG
ncbi:MAG: glutamine synthetase [Muribaculaceae bacterium]|nr:glutamine synthetase [Muribaculaceae bacterium]